LREECGLRVFENRALRRIFGPKRDEVRREWRRLHEKELYALCSSSNIRVIKSRRIKWAEHEARMGRGEVYTGVRWGNLKERNHLEHVGVNWRIILKLTLKKSVGRIYTKLIWLGIWRSGELL
jgi:hypothetical protein